MCCRQQINILLRSHLLKWFCVWKCHLATTTDYRSYQTSTVSRTIMCSCYSDPCVLQSGCSSDDQGDPLVLTDRGLLGDVDVWWCLAQPAGPTQPLVLSQQTTQCQPCPPPLPWPPPLPNVLMNDPYQWWRRCQSWHAWPVLSLVCTG